MNTINKKLLKGYLLPGILVGCLFPLTKLLIWLIGDSYESYWAMNDHSFAYFIFDTLPFSFGFLFLMFGWKIEAQKDQIENKLLHQIEVVEKTALFAEDIGKGELNTDIELENEDDVLGSALLSMRENLRQQALQEEERSWIMQGSAELGNILRNYNQVNELADAILANLVPKINAVQGAFYTTHENEEQRKQKKSGKRQGTIEMAASFAYNRKKYLKSSFNYGQGLVGQCALEMDKIVRTEVPEEFVTITSGLLGDKKPSSLLIVPLITDDILYGILEFAGLTPFSDREIKFVEELSEIIGRTLANIQTNEKTLQLLDEVNKSQQRTTELLTNASEIINIYDQDGIVQYASPSVKQILGYEPLELEGTSDVKKIHAKGAKAFKKMFVKLMDDPDVPVTAQYSYEKKNGERVWLESVGRNLFNNNAIGGILFNTIDITERRKAEQEQRERAKMQALSENSPDIILRFTLVGEISYCNPTIEKYTGIQSTYFLANTIEKLEISSTIKTKWVEYLDEIKSNEKTIASEMEFQTGSQELLFMEVNAIPEFSEEGKLESVLMVLHDITEAKKAEQKIQEQNAKITDSINYAKRIQGSILPKEVILKDVFEKSFMYFMPKDTVSGDFPFFCQKGDDFYVAAVDCTGHGVPGALLSVIGSLLLNEIIRHETPTASVLCDRLHQSVVQTLRQGQVGGENERDGMDIAMCKIDIKTGKMEYCGAHRPLYILRHDIPEGEDLEQLKGDKYPIGGVQYKGRDVFTNYETTLRKGDSIYFFSDGYPDQFGENGKKIGPKRIRKLLVENRGKDMKEQYDILDKYFFDWKGNHRQMDDVLFIGIEF